ncbi:MAG: exodeoxyribonuclease I [Deltaproteobacteria bacterium]|nr:exodeoxyribonuclease I [Deltaproteobacteria bacterium]
MSRNTLLWHDYETWGADPRRDRAAQFAALRTDEDLREVGAPLMLFCRPSRDFLPHPRAAMVTGLTPQRAEAEGLPEAEFFGRVHAELGRAGTCGVGYNSIRFDDEVTRFGLYRNFLPPYDREWRLGNSRWDLIDLARMTRALRPEGLVWPERAPGVTSFRLTDLTEANDIPHLGAHDALADVRATLGLARRIREAQPKLYAWHYKMRRKDEVKRWLRPRFGQVVLHVSGMFPSEQGHLAPVLPLMLRPGMNNEVVAIDLRVDPGPLLALGPEALAANLYARRSALPEGVARVGIKTIHLNKSPALAPTETLTPALAERWGIDLDQAQAHRAAVLSSLDLPDRLAALYALPREEEADPDPDEALYDGFITDQDAELCREVRERSPDGLWDWTPALSDPRLQRLFRRYRARSWPERLAPEEAAGWERFCRARREEGGLRGALTRTAFQAEIAAIRAEGVGDSDEEVLRALEAWAEEPPAGGAAG